MITKNISGFFIIVFYFTNFASSSTHNVTLKSKNIFRNRRMVNGGDPKLGMFEFVVHIASYKKNTRYLYAGSIISERHVLTAAQSVTYDGNSHMLPPSAILVRGGDIDLNSERIQKFFVENVIVHKQYNPINLNYDVAILKLQTKIPLTIEGFNKIELITEEVKEDGVGFIAGWGQLSEHKYRPQSKLEFQYLHKMDRKKCAELYKQHEVLPSMECFYRQDAAVSYCYGDTGAPIMYKDPENKLAGVMSWNEGCARRDKPDVFTNIALLRPWILSVLEDNKSNNSEIISTRLPVIVE